MTDTAIEKAMELLKQAELSKSILVENLKNLIGELQDKQTREQFKVEQIKQTAIPADVKGQANHQATFFTHLCNANAYGLVAKQIEVVLAASGVLNG